MAAGLRPPTGTIVAPPPPAVWSYPPPAVWRYPAPPPPIRYYYTPPSRKHATSLIVGASVGASFAALSLFLLLVFLFRRRRRLRTKNLQDNTTDCKKPPEPKHLEDQATPSSSPPPHTLHHNATSDQSQGSKSFLYGELKEATDGFSKANLIGEGGFGCVYKGKLHGRQLIAIKQLKIGSGQGEREFQAEIETISRIHHRHLVSLVGYCIFNDQRLLVYNYVANGNLHHHLHGKGMPIMDWPTRLKIALGAARGLAYLHEDCYPRIIHRDIKASNILLDEHFEAKVSDFGLAKFSSDAHTHVSTRIMGTLGYLAPEYASSGKLTDKSDVFSFGVVLLELLTGRTPIDTRQPFGLVELSRPLLAKALEEGYYEDFIDPRPKNYDETTISWMVQAAAACIHYSANRRPKMTQVVHALESDSSGLLQNVNFGNSLKQRFPYESTEYGHNQYSANMQAFHKMAFESDSIYGDTNESGLDPCASSFGGQFSDGSHQSMKIIRMIPDDDSRSSEVPSNTLLFGR